MLLKSSAGPVPGPCAIRTMVPSSVFQSTSALTSCSSPSARRASSQRLMSPNAAGLRSSSISTLFRDAFGRGCRASWGVLQRFAPSNLRQRQRPVHHAGRAGKIIGAGHVLLNQERRAAIEFLILLVAAGKFAPDQVPDQLEDRG